MSYYSFPAAPGMVPPPPMTSSNPMQPYPLLYSSGIVASAPPTGPTLPPPPPIPATTVFIGNIYERASDLMIKTMLQKCGRVINWKRVQGASGKLQAFGFCEYEDPESTLRCIRLLNGFLIGDQKLLVKVDQKTTTLLNEYRRARLKTDGTNELEEGEDDEDLTVVSNAMKADDEKILESLKSILVEYNRDLFVRSTSPIHSVDKRDGDDVPGDGSKLDDDANRMVAQSIRRFREQFRDDDDIRRDDKRRSPDQRNESKAGPPRRTYPQQRRSLPRQRRTPRVSEEPKEEDEDDETKERRRQERKLQEREAHYQAHLDRWQLREQRRQEYYRQEREHEINRRREHDRSRRCFLRYLDSYDDEKMDSKYYGGSMFTRKFKERQRELSEDARDRKREREEFAVLRRKHQISNDDGEDTIMVDEDAIVKEIKDEEDRLIRLVEDIISSRDRRSQSSSSSSASEIENGTADEHISAFTSEPIKRKSPPPARLIINNPESLKVPLVVPSVSGIHPHSLASTVSGPSEPLPTSQNVTLNPVKVNIKPKSIQQVNQAFLDDDDDMGDNHHSTSTRDTNERRLIPMEKRPLILTSLPTNADERKQAIKKIIEFIPSDTDKLYAYPVDWDMVDDDLMQGRIQPWIEKKIVEYIGEEEKTLVEFISQKILRHSAPTDILSDVRMVLDDEADVFLVKLWRLLIYETEARRNGLA